MKKRIVSMLLIFSLVLSGIVFFNQPAETKADDFYTGWKVNWSDEFDGTSLNKNVWNVEVNGYGGWNEEHQYYKDGDDTIQVNDGTLKIIGRKQTVWGTDASGTYKSYDYTSARINTENKVKLGNGRIEARIKLPIFKGTFPAFWLMGNNGKQWPECGEIDIMEAVNTENIAYGTAHWPKQVGTGSSDINSEGGGTYGWNLNLADWHVYGVERTDTAIKWYVDGRVYHTVDLTKDAANQAPLKLDAYILLNLAIGGEWPGHTIDDSAFPATMEVDYVRHLVYDPTTPTTQALTTTKTTVVNGTEVLSNTAFNGSTSWAQTSANGASFSNAGNGSVTVNVPAYTSGNAWDTQLVQTPLALDSTKYYVATYTVTSSADKTFMFLAQKTDYTAEDATVITNVKAGETKLVKAVFKPSETRDYLYGIMMGYVNQTSSPAATVKISNVSMKVYNTEAEARTAADSIPEPTTTQAPTTQAPTTVKQTTVAPTTKQATTAKVDPSVINVSNDLEINGYQISYTVEGMRTVYTTNNTINGKAVVERGLVYGLADMIDSNQLYVGSKSSYVRSYNATNTGKLGVKYSKTLSGDSYAMTMKFSSKTAVEYNTNWAIRAYAKLSDGSIVYSNVENYKIYNIATKLYDGCKMQNINAHNYLYNNIITKITPDYPEVDFDWGGAIVS